MTEAVLTPAALADDAHAGPPAERVRRAMAGYADAAAGADAVRVFRAPGRVNLIGEHTDYNDGFVLPVTLDRAVYVALRPRHDRTARWLALDFEEAVVYPLDERPAVPADSWAAYVTGVTEELRRRGGLAHGFDGVLCGDVPVGSGLSSSAALEVAVAVGLQVLFGLDLDPVETALLCQRVEQRYAGVQCGIMDQFASRLGRHGYALFLDCRTLDVEHVPLVLGDAALVVIDSKAPRALAGSKYNERRAECEAGVAYFQRHDPSIRALRDVPVSLFERHAADLPEPVRSRCRHVVEENERVLAARDLLRAGDLPAFGALMTASHASLRDRYAVSSPPLDLLVDTALAVEGVLGSRLTGAGFGGCTVTLARRDAVPVLRARVTAAYKTAFGRTPGVYVLKDTVEAGEV